MRGHYKRQGYKNSSHRCEFLGEGNTPAALALLHEWRACGQVELLARGLGVFGLTVEEAVDGAPEEIQSLAKERSEARDRRDFGRADELRAEIEKQGWEVQDVADGFRLVPKT